MLTLPPSSTAFCPSFFPRPFRYHPAQVQTFATGRLQISNNWKKKTRQTTKEHCATMQKETNSRPNNRTECSPCLHRRLHFVHLFFQGLFNIILHKFKRLQQADFKSVTTGKKKHDKQQKNTVPLCKRKPIRDPTTELNAHPASVVDCILSIFFSKAISRSSCTNANVCNRQISTQ